MKILREWQEGDTYYFEIYFIKKKLLYAQRPTKPSREKVMENFAKYQEDKEHIYKIY